MPNFNKVILAGNLCRDVEVRYTPKGTAVGASSVAINRTWTDDGGVKHEEVTFVEFSVFGKSAETMAQYTKKGSPILLEGRLKLDSWDDKQTNQKRTKLKVIVEGFQFLSFKEDDGGDERPATRRETPAAAAPASRRTTQPATPAATASSEYEDPSDDDVPF